LIIVSFEDQALHDTCVDLERAELMLGSVSAGALVSFISDALAFENVDELIDYLGGDVKILQDDSLSVAIGSDYRAALVAVGKRVVRDAADRVVWSSVTRVKLVQISRLP
jgi:hypothetical protein